MNRSLRRFATWLSLAGFLFAQAMLVAYACPLRAPAGSLPADRIATAMPSGPADAERCPGHAEEPAPESGPICASHCDSQQAVPSVSPPEVPPVVLAPFPVLVSLDTIVVAVVPSFAEPTLARAAAPPQLRYAKLLI